MDPLGEDEGELKMFEKIKDTSAGFGGESGVLFGSTRAARIPSEMASP